jgi:TPR repeat protein
LKVSADLGSPDGQLLIGWMTENGIGIPIDFVDAVRHYEMSSDGSAAGSAYCGWCWYTGKGVPVDFTIATEFFKKASDSKVLM